jgi:hypothetical protein
MDEISLFPLITIPYNDKAKPGLEILANVLKK